MVGASKSPVVVTIQDSTGRRARATLALGLDACSDRGGAVCRWASGNLIGVVALLFRLAASGEGVGVPQAAVLLQAVPAVASVAGFGASRNLRAVAPVVTSAVTSVAGLAVVALVVVVAGIWVVRIVGEASSSMALASTIAGIIISVIHASLAEWTAGVGAGVAGTTTVIRSARRPRVGAAIAVPGALSVAGVVVALLSTSPAATTGIRATSVAPGTTRT